MSAHQSSAAARLNRDCACITLDRQSLARALDREAGDAGFSDRLLAAQPHAFAHVPVFLSGDQLAKMEEVVAAIETVSRLAQYQAAVLAWAPEIARRDFGPAGAMMGYDFHLTANGPSLIEINTNAGGAFLNAALARAQVACCGDAIAFPDTGGSFEDAARNMFLEEWSRQRGKGQPGTVAIIDDTPERQFLYPEFVLAREALLQRGIRTVIADAARLRRARKQGRLPGREAHEARLV
jgi:hypothetical protein